ncbi:hypothetical protein BD289DRAFT_378536 [Coniella lustricola]|uniref:Nucleic acid-binding protein n=1 Tax=Coniella lustricola TaxID=2025994 RepID=A0A2T2ZU10_9PEZI|nr:hypothetical protein BD289DRAFT_378536 [Coniella lustricola]
MTGRVLVLTGAPESHRLDWTSTGLLSTFQPAVASFLAWTSSSSTSATPDFPSNAHTLLVHCAVWRSLAPRSAHIHTGFSQQHHLDFVAAYPSSADFFTTTSFSTHGRNAGPTADARLLHKFYVHSLAKHNDILTSQLVTVPQSQQQQEHSTLAPQESSQGNSGDNLDATSHANASSLLKTLRAPPAWATRVGHLSNLCDIPSAAYLTSIMPSTMTVSLIAGIISIAAPRTVTTRYGTTKTLVEVLVGDETKSGFSITFWLAGAQVGARSAVDEVLAMLRNQDVVLLENVALNVFGKKVYGSSLRRDMTKLHLLYRVPAATEGHQTGHNSHTDLARAGKVQFGQADPLLDKTRRVRAWVLRFVAQKPGLHATAEEDLGRHNAKPGPREWNLPPPLESQ